jgi:hypothetical protein
MSRRLPRVAVALVPVLALAACQDPDVGDPCTLQWSATWEQDGTDPPPDPKLVASDYFESGNLACEGLVCIVSPAAGTKYFDYASGYCSKPCVSDADCFESDTGLVCRQMVLDAVFLEQMDPITRDRYLSQIQFSSYCAIPR